jgi:hypothetical protein
VGFSASGQRLLHEPSAWPADSKSV